MANDHARDRYDPPKVGSEFETEIFSEINPGELFRMKSHDQQVMYRKTNENTALELKTMREVQFDVRVKVYVKS